MFLNREHAFILIRIFLDCNKSFFLKFLGFSLSEIKELAFADADSHFLVDSLNIQQKLIQDKIEQLQLVEKAIQDTTQLLDAKQEINWNDSLNLIHLTQMETSLKKQYLDASNISARINLHKLYSTNPQGWYPWIFEQCQIKEGMKVLELGCGDGTFWSSNLDQLPANIQITVSDISQGMLNDARRNLGGDSDIRFLFQLADANSLPYEDEAFDLVIANHVLFYCNNLNDTCSEISRVLKKEGTFISSAYSKHHMKEISQLVQDFDNRILLSADKLYEHFGKENGYDILSPYFTHCQWISYQDSLSIPEPDSLISYILSCHGNQNQYILENYKDFCSYVGKKTMKKFYITKDSGIFISKKQKNS